MRSIALLCITCLALGCGKSEEPEFQGKPLSEWLAQADGKNPQLRRSAYEALGGFQDNGDAIRVLEQALNDENVLASDRLVAAKSLYRASRNAAKVLEPIAALIRKESDAPLGLQSANEVGDLIFWLGPKAQPLVPDLQAAAAKVPGRDPASQKRRQQIQDAIDAIPRG